MKDEYFEDLSNFECAFADYLEWAKLSKTVGTMTFLQGLKNAYDKMSEAKKEMDLWHI